MNTASKAKLDEAIGKAEVELEGKNRKFEKLRFKLESNIAQDKVMKSLVIAKKMAKVFAEMVSLLDQIGEYKDTRRELENAE